MIIEHIKHQLKNIPLSNTDLRIGYIKEVLQHYILMHIYEQTYAKNIRFYGGTALRILHGLDRLSEDLDFVGIWFDRYEELGNSLVKFFKRHDLEVTMKTKYFRIKLFFRDFLEQFWLSFGNSHMLMLKIEISDHFAFAHDYTIQPFVVKKYGTSSIINSFSLEDLMGTKLNAVLYRERTQERMWVSFKWRDYYDLFRYLTQKVKPHLGTIDGVDDYDTLKQLLSDKINNIDIDQACLDIKKFIETPQALEQFRTYAKIFMLWEIAKW